MDGSEWRAVKYLQSHVDGDAVSDVATQPHDPNYQLRQQEYRAQDRTIREVDTRYADPLGEVVDNPLQDRVEQLAADLSGIYGPYRVHMFRAEVDSSGLVIIGGIKRIGSVAGALVPFMCLIYMASACSILLNHLGEIPDYFALIFR